jgi:hypothetical protein
MREIFVAKCYSRLALFAACVAVPVQVSAQECVQPAEAQALMQFAMPDILEGIMKQCQAHLTPTGFVAKSGATMVTRYRIGSDAKWPLAKTAFFKIAGKDSSGLAMQAMPDSVLKGLITFGVTAKATNEISSDDCGKVERLMEALSPLPPENTASVITLILEIGSSKNEKGNGGLKMCTATSAAATASK